MTRRRVELGVLGVLVTLAGVLRGAIVEGEKKLRREEDWKLLRALRFIYCEVAKGSGRWK
jgi:hypothetical protein